MAEKPSFFYCVERGEGKIRPSRISDRQSRRWRVLDSRFAGVEYSIHPQPNPLYVRGSLRLGFFPRDLLHVKNPLSGTLRGAGEGNIRPSRISDRQSRRWRVLDSRFAGVEYSIHPQPNPLHVSGSLRLGFFPRDPHHVKSPLSGTLRGAGEGNIRPSRISDRQSRRWRVLDCRFPGVRFHRTPATEPSPCQ